MVLPHDYVNYVKVSWVGDDGSERLIRKTNDTSNPTALLQDSDYKYIFDSNSELTAAEDSETYKKFKANILRACVFDLSSGDEIRGRTTVREERDVVFQNLKSFIFVKNRSQFFLWRDQIFLLVWPANF